MDKNQVIGFILIGVILIGYMFWAQPSKEELEAAKRRQDSIAKVQEKLHQQKLLEEQKRQQQIKEQDSLQKIAVENQDTANLGNKLVEIYGPFGNAVKGENKFITVETNKMEVKLATKGGRIYSVRLKDYVTHDSLPLILFNGDQNIMGLEFFAGNKNVATNDLYFQPVVNDSIIDATKKEQVISLRLKASDSQYVEYVYKFSPDKYLVDYDIKFVNLDNVINRNANFMDFVWKTYVPRLERGNNRENMYTTVFYKYFQDDVEELSGTKDEDEAKMPTSVRWIAFKQQFFSSVLINYDKFENGEVSMVNMHNENDILKIMNARLGIEYQNDKKQQDIELAFYFGPNHYKTLKSIKLKEDDKLMLEKMIPLGSGIIAWINKYAIIPLFNFLGRFTSNYGLIILLMTLIIKAFLFPLTYKSYMSSAKMRVLKPQIDEINKKYPKEKAMERQQATMALYKKAGVNPMGGCIPVLLQFPILIAMFRFFPASIELRQKSFLWADDLSSYDSILNLPFTIPWYGDHVSLFTLLMAAAILVNTMLNSSNMNAQSSQMPGMKTMMYLMPVMMVFWFNDYSAGLSYYYFLSNLITIAQTYGIRKFVDEEAILAKLNENVKKNKKVKKSKFQQRLEEIQKQQEAQKRKRK